MRKQLLGILLFFVGAYFSAEYAARYWVVGPIFGTVVLAWVWITNQSVQPGRRVAFFAASTLIYALVWFVVKLKLSNYLGINDLSIAVAVGSLLLPWAHQRCLGSSRKRVLLAIPAVYLAYQLGGWALAQLSLPDPLEKWINIVSLWQGTYLLCFFGNLPKAKQPAP